MLLLLIFIFLGTALFAQDLSGSSGDSEASPLISGENPDEGPIEVDPSFLLSEAGGGVRFVQRLTWEKAQYAVRYSVLMERRSDELDIWQEVLRRNMDADILYIDVSVPAGDYRYRVYSFNIIGRLDSQTDWEYFVVLKAIQPSILTFSPEAFFFDRETPRIINLTGEGLFPESEFYLESLTLFDEDGEPYVINTVDQHLNELGETARLFFNEEDLVEGKYNIVVVSPGGLSSVTGVFSIAVAKPFDVNVSVGYTPNLTLYGLKDYFLDKVFVAGSVSVRASYVPYKRDFGFFGMEISPGWTLLTSGKDKEKKSTAQMVLVNFNALYQYNIVPHKLFLNGRAGFGIAGIFNYHFKYSETGKNSPDSLNFTAFSLNIGASFQWFIRGQIYFEGGLDYVHIIHKEVPMGFIRMGIFGGYQF